MPQFLYFVAIKLVNLQKQQTAIRLRVTHNSMLSEKCPELNQTGCHTLCYLTCQRSTHIPIYDLDHMVLRFASMCA